MQPRSRKSLETIAAAAEFIRGAVEQLSVDDYRTNVMVRSAIERNLEIIGESPLRIERTDPGLSQQIPDPRKIIGLRNRLSHGYDEEIDHDLVWEAARTSVPELAYVVARLLS